MIILMVFGRIIKKILKICVKRNIIFFIPSIEGGGVEKNFIY